MGCKFPRRALQRVPDRVSIIRWLDTIAKDADTMVRDELREIADGCRDNGTSEFHCIGENQGDALNPRRN